METVLIATDSDSIFDEVDATFGSGSVRVERVRAGREVRGAVDEFNPSAVLLDMQIGSMGGVAACLDLRNEEGAGRMRRRRIVLLLDREADVFLAEQSGADAWVVKPLEAGTLASTVEAVRQPR